MATGDSNGNNGRKATPRGRSRAKAATKTPTKTPTKAAPTAPVETGDDPIVELVDEPVVERANEHDLEVLMEERRAKLIKAGVLGAIAVVLITFVIQNADPVGLRILVFTVSVRLIWVIVGAVALGAAGGFLLGRPGKDLRLHGPKRRKNDS